MQDTILETFRELKTNMGKYNSYDNRFMAYNSVLNKFKSSLTNEIIDDPNIPNPDKDILRDLILCFDNSRATEETLYKFKYLNDETNKILKKYCDIVLENKYIIDYENDSVINFLLIFLFAKLTTKWETSYNKTTKEQIEKFNSYFDQKYYLYDISRNFYLTSLYITKGALINNNISVENIIEFMKKSINE